MSAVLNGCVIILNRFQPQFALSQLKFFCGPKIVFIPVIVGVTQPEGLHRLGVPPCLPAPPCWVRLPAAESLVDLGLASVNLEAGVSGAGHAVRFPSHRCTPNYVVSSFVLGSDSAKTIDMS